MIIYLFLLLFAAPAGAATTYWVAATGGSTGANCAAVDGTSDPGSYLRTIAGGIACLVVGDTLIIKDGTYAEYITFNQIPSGTAAARTTIKSNTSLGARLCPTTGTPTAGTGHVIWVYGKSYITFDGLNIDASCITSPLSTSNAFFANNNSNNIIIQNSEIENSASNCAANQGGAHTVTYKNNKIHDCGTTTMDHGIYAQGANNIIENNEIYNSTGHGIHQFHQSTSVDSNNIMRYNYVHNNGSRCAIIGSGANQLFHHNICATNSVTSGSSAIRVDSGGPTNSQIYNNTFYDNKGVCIEILTGTNARVKNNLCLSNTTNTITVGTATGTEGACGTFGNRCSTTAADVIDVATSRFSPREASAMIDAGVNISGFSSGKFHGSLPDIGALEAPIPGTPVTQSSTVVRVPFTIVGAGVQAGTGLQGGAFGNFAVTEASAGKTETALNNTQTNVADVTVTGAMAGSPTAITIGYTRPTTGGLTDNIKIGGSSGNKNAEVRTFAPLTATNTIASASTPVWATVNFRCFDLTSSIDSPEWRAPQQTAEPSPKCKTVRDGWGAIALTVTGTVADPESSGFEIHSNENGGGYGLLPNSCDAAKFCYGVHPAAGIADGQAISAALSGLTDPHSNFISGGEVVGQQRSLSVDLGLNSSFQSIIAYKVGSTANAGEFACFQIRRTGAVTISNTVIPCIEVQDYQASR